MKNTILCHIKNLYTPVDHGIPVRGNDMNNIKIIEDAYIVIFEEEILEVGSGDGYKLHITPYSNVIELRDKIVTPGFVDSHTHLIHGGSRENEFQLKLNGVSYLEILAQGGGILSTVKSTREASKAQLKLKATKSLDTMLIHGTTTIEAKSGYGLDLENEIKQLEAALELNNEHNIDIISTFMGAHAVPLEYKEKPEEYIDLMLNSMLPKVKDLNLAEFCDIFCEDGVFSVSQSREILKKAKDLGFKVKLHADEIVSLGGAELGAEVGAISAEHLMAASSHGIKMMAKANTIANILPGTTFSLLKNTYAPAREMINEGVAVALSSDYNPGSCPTENLQLIMQLGCMYLRMTPKEVLTATTLNGAYCIDRGDSRGSLESGKLADIVVLDAPNLDYVYYHFGINHVVDVYKKGKLVVKNKNLV